LNKGPYGVETVVSYINASLGDIVQGHNGSQWRHSTIVTKIDNATGSVYVTGRTGKGVSNNNQLSTTIYGRQRLIALRGNY